MAEATCKSCGKTLRTEVAAGLCPRCLLLSSLIPVPEVAGPAAVAADPVVRRIGPYEVMDEIARGGMGIVFRARDRRLGREVALKLVRGGEWAAGELLERFRTEARAAASLQHPHIVPVYGFGDDDGNWYIAMRLITGGSLARWGCRPANGRVAGRSERDVALVLFKLAEAVHYAHQRGVLHRDLKPENVLLAEPPNHATHLRMAQALFNPSGDRLLTLSYDNTARLWDGKDGHPLVRGILHPMLIHAAR